MSAQDKLDKLVNAHMSATGENKYTAYAKVANTDEGKKLISELYV